MKAFVTGATGFLGTHLCQQLHKDGWHIYAFHRPTSDLSELSNLSGITYVVGDVRDSQSLSHAMPRNVDAVFHTAGSVGFIDPSKEKDQYEINELGTRNVIETAIKKKARRLIYTSTILTYDWSSRITEESPLNKSSKYAYIHSKYLAEQEVEKGIKNGLDAVILHPSAIFGSHDKAGWSKVFREIEHGLKIPASPPGAVSFCHMPKVAHAHLQAFYKGRRGEHYVLGGPDVTMMQIAREAATLLGKPAPLCTLPSPMFRLAIRAEYAISKLLQREPMLYPSLADVLCETILCDSTKAISELDYEPSSLEVMLKDCFQWMRTQRI